MLPARDVLHCSCSWHPAGSDRRIAGTRWHADAAADGGGWWEGSFYGCPGCHLDWMPACCACVHAIEEARLGLGRIVALHDHLFTV